MADPTLLDYESTPELKLIVSAVADGNHAYASLLVRLTDENDNAPKFAQTTYVSAIWENNKPQTYITQVRVHHTASQQRAPVTPYRAPQSKNQSKDRKYTHTQNNGQTLQDYCQW